MDGVWSHPWQRRSQVPLAGEETDTASGSPLSTTSSTLSRRGIDNTDSHVLLEHTILLPRLDLEHSPRRHGRTPVAQCQGGTTAGIIAPEVRGSVRTCLPSSTANSATDQLTALEKIQIYAMIRQIYAHVYPEQHDVLTMRVGFMTLGHTNPVELYIGICALHGITPVPEYSGQ